MQTALALIKDRLGECRCAGHVSLKARLKRAGKEALNANSQVEVGDVVEDAQMIAADALVSSASTSKLAQRLAKQFYHDCLNFKNKDDDEKSAEVLI